LLCAVVATAPPALTPWRPALFFAAVALTIAGLVWLAMLALSPGGFGAVDAVLVALFAVTLPWYVIGFWNATIGLAIMRFARDPVAAVTPVAGRVRETADHRLDRDPAVTQRAARAAARLLDPCWKGSPRASASSSTSMS
jgi:membrane glycosyltransferase